MVKPKTLLVGVDAGETKYDTCILNTCYEYRKDFTIGVRKQHRDEIARRVCEAADKNELSEVQITIETSSPTSHILKEHLSNYEWPAGLNVNVDLISSVIPKQFKKLELIECKTDKIDAYAICQCGKFDNLPKIKRHSKKLKSLASEYEFITKTSTAHKSRIRSLFLEMNPVLVMSFSYVHNSKFTPVAIECYEVYASNKELTPSDLDEVLQKNDYEMSQRMRKILIAIINKESIDSSIHLIDSIKRQYEILKRLTIQLKSVKSEIKKFSSDSPDVKTISTVGGVATFTASMFVGIIQDIDRFDEVDKFVGYLGTHPVKSESGKTHKKSKMSNKGVGVLKKLLFTSAMSAVNYYEYPRRIFQKAISRGKTPRQAYGVVMTRIARWIYGVWKSGEPWKANKRYLERKQKNKEKGLVPQP